MTKPRKNASKNSKTGIVGVTLRKNGMFRATITVDKSTKYLGEFITIDEAIKARRLAVIECKSKQLDEGTVDIETNEGEGILEVEYQEEI